mmetsp:Transcript_16819/g.40559  ORF Transcript_16819/g.40559 Transcript_16819/m.40559 type:complete len:746 (+) Transcript_16819:1170-3407(+)
MHRPQKTLQIRHPPQYPGLRRHHHVEDPELLQVQLRGVRRLDPADGLAGLGRGAELRGADLAVRDVVTFRDVGPAQTAGPSQQLLGGEFESAGGEVGSYHLGGSESASNLQGGPPRATTDLQHTPELPPGLRHACRDPLRKNNRVHLAGHLVDVEVETELGAQAAVSLIGDCHLLRHGGPGNVPEPGVLVEMLAESVAAVTGRPIRPRGGPAAPQDHPVHPIDGGGGEIVVQGMGAEPREHVDGRGGVLPDVAQDVGEPRRRVHKLVHRARRRPVLQIHVARGLSLGPRRSVLRALLVRGDEIPEAVVFVLRGQPHDLAELLGFETTESRSFKVAHLRRPVPRHWQLRVHRPQHPLLTLRALTTPPEPGHLGLALRGPLPSLLVPILLILIPTGTHELQELGVAHQVLRRFEGLDRDLRDRVRKLVVPAVQLGGLPQPTLAGGSGGHRQQLVGGRRRPLSTQVEGPGRAHRQRRAGLHQAQGRLAQDHGGRLEVDALVLDAHHQHVPEGVVLDRQGHGLGGDTFVNEVPDAGAEIEIAVQKLAGVVGIGHGLFSGGPRVVPGVQVIPSHFIHTHSRLHLHHRVDPLGTVDELPQQQLVDVEARRVPHIKNGWVPELLVLDEECHWGGHDAVELLEEVEGVVEVLADLSTLGFGARALQLYRLESSESLPVLFRRLQPSENLIVLRPEPHGDDPGVLLLFELCGGAKLAGGGYARAGVTDGPAPRLGAGEGTGDLGAEHGPARQFW